MPLLVRSAAGMRIRAAIRPVLRAHANGTFIVALSGGADSLALLVACAEEVASAAFRGSGVRIRAAVIDHGLQADSAEIAERAAAHARSYGVPVDVRRIDVSTAPGSGGTEAAARSARYDALVAIATERAATVVLTAHTRDDQAEQVLLALARGSGTRSLAGIPAERELAPGVQIMRPLLTESAGITRADTVASCADHELDPWQDPHNNDTVFARVRARRVALPMLETEFGPGVAAAFARTADIAREDADALDALASEALVAIAAARGADDSGDELPIAAVADLLPAVRNRVIRGFAAALCGAQLTREHTQQVVSLVTDWRGQSGVNAAGVSVQRVAGNLVFLPHG
ncbi:MULTISPECIES: tRNA lysidine(34) synthetase TilS [unclassified Leucobacter]|uniref:tRNA lysidine(34) synthetase TilS n=1 Tax=unclassified Leucobacter TaxID=2621730 RepID=UPI00203B57DC|nr:MULTISPECIES: tRNA lysidine(34) synthetase TilS [unclassified Leucobacter]